MEPSPCVHTQSMDPHRPPGVYLLTWIKLVKAGGHAQFIAYVLAHCLHGRGRSFDIFAHG
jgi:hypothetical protein